jgi:hypothetical protein
MVVQPPVVLQRLGSLAHSRPAGHFFKTLRSSLGLSFSAVVKLSGHLRAMSCARPGFSHPNTHGVVAPNMALLIWALAVSHCPQRGSLRLAAE